MPVSKTAVDAVKPSRPARKAPVEAAAEDAALQLGELSELLGYSLKRAQLKVFEDFLRCMAPLQLTPAQFSVLLLLDRESRPKPDRDRQHARHPPAEFRGHARRAGKPRSLRADALHQRPPVPRPGADRQGPRRAGAREKAGCHQARGAAERIARACQSCRAAGDAGEDRAGVSRTTCHSGARVSANPESHAVISIPGSSLRNARDDGVNPPGSPAHRSRW